MGRRLLALLLLLVPAGFAEAQQNLQRIGATGVAFEALHPVVKHANTTVLSAGYYLSAHHQLGEQIYGIVELPFAYLSEGNGFSFDNNSNALGNPYIGGQLRRGIFTYDLGARLPTVSHAHNASELGFFADLQRMEAFIPDLLTLHGGAAVQSVPRNNISFGANVSPAYMVFTSNTQQDNELYLDYGANIGYRVPQARLALRYDAVVNVAGSGRFADWNTHQAVFTGDFGTGRARPGLYVAWPLDHDLGETLDATIGLTLQLALRD